MDWHRKAERSTLHGQPYSVFVSELYCMAEEEGLFPRPVFIDQSETEAILVAGFSPYSESPSDEAGLEIA